MTFRTRGLWRAASSSAMVPTPADFSGKRMIASLFVAFVAGTAYARDKCTAIHFAPGHSSITVKGVARPEQALCYSFAAAAGQTAILKVAGKNMIISVVGLGDAHAAWTFTTKAQTYTFIVAQMMRSVTSEPYTVSLSLK